MSLFDSRQMPSDRAPAAFAHPCQIAAPDSTFFTFFKSDNATSRR
jgi:hypothetical protein